MNNQAIECNDEQLLLAIRTDNDELPDSLAHHVENCARCQSRLSELVATGERWGKATSALSPGKSQQSPHNDSTWLGQRRWSERPLAWTESMVKQLLEPPTHPEMLGRLGRYEIEQLIGSGGMGVVFKAYDTELNRPVAIKLLAPQLSENGSARKRFAREARAAAGVVDDHVVPIFNVESDGDPPFLVMQYIAGGSLQEMLDRNGPLKVSEILRIGLQAAKGLAAAHAQGLIHRDVKPSNILLDEGVERALLTDFGLARAENDACLTRSGFHPGTPHYMSPEQVRGESIDGRSDLFALGCILYAACAGHPPFRAESSYAVLRRVTDDSPRPLREVNSEVPQWLEQIVMRLLAKSAEDRYQSAAEVAELLENCLAHVQRPTAVSLPNSVEELANSFGSKNANAKRNDSRGGFRLPPISKHIAGAFLSLFLLAGIFITLETGKGTITIESEVDNVPIVIKKGDEVYEKLIVNRDGKSIRVYAGEYEVAFDGEPASMKIDNSSIALRWGDDSIVRIRQATHVATTLEKFKQDTRTPSVPQTTPSTFKESGLVGTWELASVDGKHAKDIVHTYIQLSFTLDGRVRLVRPDAKTMAWHYGADSEYLMFIQGDDELESPYTQICQWAILDDGRLHLIFSPADSTENLTEMTFTPAPSSRIGSISSNQAQETFNASSSMVKDHIRGIWRALGAGDFWLWIHEDGTWKSENRYPRRAPLKMNGTWTLKGTMLTMRILASEIESEPVGSVRRGVIRALDHRRLVVGRANQRDDSIFFRQDFADYGTDTSFNGTNTDEEANAKSVEGTVLSRHGGGNVSISVGSDDGLVKGHKLRVFLEDKDLGEIEITTCSADQAVARILQEHSQARIRMGDKVTTEPLEPKQVASPITSTQAPIVGAILSRTHNRVQLSVGLDDGLKPGSEFRVFASAKCLGTIRVVTTSADKATAEIMSEEAQMPIRRGDQIASMLPPLDGQPARKRSDDPFGHIDRPKKRPKEQSDNWPRRKDSHDPTSSTKAPQDHSEKAIVGFWEPPMQEAMKSKVSLAHPSRDLASARGRIEELTTDQAMTALMNPALQRLEFLLQKPALNHANWEVLSTDAVVLKTASSLLVEEPRSEGDDWERIAGRLGDSATDLSQQASTKNITKARECLKRIKGLCIECHASYRN